MLIFTLTTVRKICIYYKFVMEWKLPVLADKAAIDIDLGEKRRGLSEEFSRLRGAFLRL